MLFSCIAIVISIFIATYDLTKSYPQLNSTKIEKIVEIQFELPRRWRRRGFANQKNVYFLDVFTAS